MSSSYYKLGQRRVDVDGNDPNAWGVCDRCGFLRGLRQLRWQMQWNAEELFNQRILICTSCWDKPQEQLKQLILPPDPIGIPNARPEFFRADEVDFLSTQNDEHLLTQDDENIVANQASENFPDPPEE